MIKEFIQNSPQSVGSSLPSRQSRNPSQYQSLMMHSHERHWNVTSAPNRHGWHSGSKIKMTKVYKRATVIMNDTFYPAAIAGAVILVPCHVFKSLKLIWRLGTSRWNLWPYLQMSCNDLTWNRDHQDSSPSNGHQGDIQMYFYISQNDWACKDVFWVEEVGLYLLKFSGLDNGLAYRDCSYEKGRLDSHTTILSPQCEFLYW